MFNIAQYAMLAQVNIRSWSGEVTDKAATKRVTEDAGAEADAARVIDHLVSRRELAAIKSIAGKARNHVQYRYTLPWSDSGARILPVTLHEQYMQEMLAVKNEYEAAVEQFLDKYPNLVAAAAMRMAGLYNPDLYPSVSELRDRFTFHVKLRPIPKGDDFRVSLSEDVVEAVRAEMDSEVEETMIEAMHHVYDRVLDVVGSMADGLERHGVKVEGKKKASYFKDSLIENVRSLVTILPKLNVVNDPKLNELSKRIEAKLTQYDAEDLKEDEVLRQEIATEAKSIVDEAKNGRGRVPLFEGFKHATAAE